MDNRKDKICIIVMLCAVIVFVIMYIGFSSSENRRSVKFLNKTIDYNNRIEQEKNAKAEAERKTTAILEKTPGVVCWGDGITFGTGGDGVSYPLELSNILKSNGYPYEVLNMGVDNESSLTVLGRAGAIPFILGEDITVSGTGDELTLIKLTSEKGEEVNPCLQEKNPGFNPCIMAGLKCTIYGDVSKEDPSKAAGYYLSRGDNKVDKIDIPKGTVIETSGSSDYSGYIHVIQLGDGGGYNGNDDTLFEQEKSFVKKVGDSGKYIIIGRLSGSAEDNKYLDKKMSDAFGRHYLNIRELLCQSEFEGVTYSQEDKLEMAAGKIPTCLKNENYLNAAGYKAVGKVLYERLKSLNIIEK